jgi:protein SCO1/2
MIGPDRRVSSRVTVRTLPVRWLGVLTLLAALTPIAGCQREAASSSSSAAAGPLTARPPLNFGGDFTLTNQDGQPFKLADVRGKPVLLFFGYTSCPDMCPMTMSRIMSARSLLGAQGESVVTLFVSVDPKRDTPTQLKHYVTSFSAPLVALTGNEDEIKRVAAKYHASYEYTNTESPNYLVNHTTAIFLIDPQGRLRQYVGYDVEPQRLADGIRAMIAGT